MKLNWTAGLALSIALMLIFGAFLSMPNGDNAIKLASAPSMVNSVPD